MKMLQEITVLVTCDYKTLRNNLIENNLLYKKIIILLKKHRWFIKTLQNSINNIVNNSIGIFTKKVGYDNLKMRCSYAKVL